MPALRLCGATIVQKLYPSPQLVDMYFIASQEHFGVRNEFRKDIITEFILIDKGR
tara:strand:+ start:234 stop:398 length:165 start_codon:yes stop_codon:yes gene_type:complete